MKKIYRCKNSKCNNEVCYRTWKYEKGICSSCAHQGIKLTEETKNKIRHSEYHQNHKEKKHPNYIDGRTLKKYKCKTCGKPICIATGIYGSGLCMHCSNMKVYTTVHYRKKISNIMQVIMKNPKIRRKMSLSLGGTGIPYENAKYPEAFTDKLRYSIRNRDGFKCQMSGMTEKEHLENFGRVLEVHHIDYNKQNYKPTNLITLTHLWNVEVNANRKYWTKYFKNLIKLGGKNAK